MYGLAHTGKDVYPMTKTFNKAEYVFFQKEFALSASDVAMLSDDELYDLGDKCFEIETEEAIAADGSELSDRGKIAAGIVTRINK